jgi:hypothetical protein
MLYHEVPKTVSQLFAMIIDKKINDTTYKVTSKNYFALTNTFQVLAKNLPHAEIINLKSVKTLDGLSIHIVNTPMSKLVIELDKPLDLQPMDMLRIFN